jgi:hypothetical protein
LRITTALVAALFAGLVFAKLRRRNPARTRPHRHRSGYADRIHLGRDRGLGRLQLVAQADAAVQLPVARAAGAAGPRKANRKVPRRENLHFHVVGNARAHAVDAKLLLSCRIINGARFMLVNCVAVSDRTQRLGRRVCRKLQRGLHHRQPRKPTLLRVGCASRRFSGRRAGTRHARPSRPRPRWTRLRAPQGVTDFSVSTGPAPAGLSLSARTDQRMARPAAKPIPHYLT